MSTPSQLSSAEALPRLAPVEALLRAMTLGEKVGQMAQHAYGHGDLEDVERRICAGQMGSLLNVRGLEERNRLQRLAVAQSRLKIPLIFGRDVIHGFKTVFPIPLGQAASFNPKLSEAACAVAAREASEWGIDWTFAPMLDIARDPRWGRVAESLGEDPYLASEFARAMVRGFQGEHPKAQGRMAACAKHFVGYGASESGKDYNTTWIPELLLREVHLPPFHAAVGAGVLTVMSAFNDLNGVPATASEVTLRQILKREWGFSGFVVSDWGATTEMLVHGICETEAEVAQQAVLAGLDMEMAERSFVNELAGLVERGRVPVEVVDEAVRRVLLVKHQLGLFEKPYVEPVVASCIGAPQHLEQARVAARESVVLLQNQDSVLPLDSGLRSLAVVGPLADDAHNQLGCWAYDGDRALSVTPLGALRERLGDSVQISAAPGLPDCRSADQGGFAEAVAAVQKSEVALVFLGEDANISGECRSRAFLDLPGAQLALLEALAATGTPLIGVIMAGRPLVLGPVVKLVRGLLFAWHPGSMGGAAIADLLLGIESPSGRLPISFPRTVGQIPIYYSIKNTGRPPKTDFKGIPEGTPLDPVGFDSSYLDVEVTPEFPFGFGLSYSSFEYSELSVTPATARIGETVRISVSLHNTGAAKAKEVAQLYVRDLVGSVTRPVRELKGFQKLELEAGERRRVEFELQYADLAFHGRDLQSKVEPGAFRVFVGSDSRARLAASFEVVS